ncbi:MFS transporter [Qingshengfaniella alkalisoli]|uniref:MFS transporter n=1 Tax=Qingshengfaniella alkalisoli TaxID=2599296 RepID=A0A5B8IXW6_9RHOB|nr:MFS transporter [Qingshengfaniella alkalisoli]QDY70584.1 MFS transporter [Qingshengfaniella alkalisoli]
MINTPRARTPLPILITLAAATLTASLGISVASVLLPTLTRSFSATVSDVQWVMLAYLMSTTVAIVSAGRLGDLFGHRRVLNLGLFVFAAASALSAVAPGLGLLVTGRSLQGLAGAILIALPMSLARDLVPEERMGTAMGLLGTTSAAGTALGPSLGGMLLTWGDWRVAFWLLTGLATVTLILSITSIPRVSVQGRASFRDLDCPGTCLLVVAIAAYALATNGGGTAVPVPQAGLIFSALVAITLFVFVEARVATPLVPITLLSHRTTGIAFIMNLLVGTVMMSTLVVGPFFLAFSLGLNEARIGVVLAVGPLVGAFFGIPAGRLTDRFGARRVMVVGLTQTMFGLLCLAYLPLYLGVGGYVIALILLTPAFQLFLAAINTAVLADASKEQRGRLAGLLGLSRNLGLMTGASVMPSLFVAILGKADAAQARPADVAHAFSMTFATAAGLALVAVGLAVYSHAGRFREAPDPAE